MSMIALTGVSHRFGATARCGYGWVSPLIMGRGAAAAFSAHLRQPSGRHWAGAVPKSYDRVSRMYPAVSVPASAAP